MSLSITVLGPCILAVSSGAEVCDRRCLGVDIFVLMSVVNVGLHCFLFPVGTKCVFAFIIVLVKCCVASSTNVYSVIWKFQSCSSTDEVKSFNFALLWWTNVCRIERGFYVNACMS